MKKTIEHQESHIAVASPDDNAVDLLHRASGLSKQQVKATMSKGAVWLTRGAKTQRIRRAKRSLAAGDELHLYYDARILAEVPAEPVLLADAASYSVWHKPYGLRSQGSKWGDHCTLARWAEQHLQPERPAFIVHRLDRAASGLLLLAHSKSVAAALSALFAERKIEKRYRAIVAGDLSQQPSPITVAEAIDMKEAISEISFLQLSANGKQSLVDVRIETGRKHQIRRHLQAIGYPICGDRMYGAGAEDGVDLQLAAYLLAFQCPVKNQAVEFKLPAEFVPAVS